MQTAWLPIPHRKQSRDGYCLPACVEMVTAYWQKPISQKQAARLLGTKSFGTRNSNVQRLQSRHYDVIYRSGSLAELNTWIAEKVPLILFVNTSELQSYWQISTPHAVVLAGINEQNAYLFDPDTGEIPQLVSVDELMLAWIYFDYAYAVLRPT